MRTVSVSLVICVLAASLCGAARADDEFMKECLVTATQKMCDCISAKMPADKRAAAVVGMRKSNAATQPGGKRARSLDAHAGADAGPRRRRHRPGLVHVDG